MSPVNLRRVPSDFHSIAKKNSFFCEFLRFSVDFGTFWEPKSLQNLPKTSPKSSQMEPKTSPNQIFEGFFGLFFSYREFASIFCFFLQNLRVFSKADLQIPCAHAMFRVPPHRLTLFEKSPEIIEKSSQNPPQTFHQTSKNRSQIAKNRYKNAR